MCLITFNWRQHDRYRLILVANRDEFFERPTLPLHQWENGIYAGKDLKGGGTWMGIHPNGRFAALTNYRDLDHPKDHPISRGKLVKDFLSTDLPPKAYLEKIERKKEQYDGFNLLVADKEEMWYYSNYAEGISRVHSGLHGLSNALLDEPWKKVRESKYKLEQLIASDAVTVESLIAIHLSTEEEQIENLPYTGATKEVEKALSAPFIKDIQGYGTVNITVLLWENDGHVQVLEKQVKKNGIPNGDKGYTFLLE